MKKLVFVCVIILAIVACKSSDDGNGGGTANVIMVEGPTLEEEDIFFSYIGVVKNVGSAEAREVKIYFTAKRADGSTIRQEWSYPDSRTLAPQATSPYKVTFAGWVRDEWDPSKTTYEITWL
ncbi:MAG: hypothetical protein WBC70_08885 [Candidatus Aminicenantales bacterium]